MAMKLKEVHDSALALPARSRAKLASELLRSLDPAPVPSKQEQAIIDAQWESEIKLRIDAIDRGEAKLIPGQVVMKRLRARLK